MLLLLLGCCLIQTAAALASPPVPHHLIHTTRLIGSTFFPTRVLPPAACFEIYYDLVLKNQPDTIIASCVDDIPVGLSPETCMVHECQYFQDPLNNKTRPPEILIPRVLKVCIYPSSPCLQFLKLSVDRNMQVDLFVEDATSTSRQKKTLDGLRSGLLHPEIPRIKGYRILLQRSVGTKLRASSAAAAAA